MARRAAHKNVADRCGGLAVAAMDLHDRAALLQHVPRLRVRKPSTARFPNAGRPAPSTWRYAHMALTRSQFASVVQQNQRSFRPAACRIYERLKAEKQAEDDARDERERMVDLMYQEQVCVCVDTVPSTQPRHIYCCSPKIVGEPVAWSLCALLHPVRSWRGCSTRRWHRGSARRRRPGKRAARRCGPRWRRPTACSCSSKCALPPQLLTGVLP